MKILMVCNYYAPENTIAAVRISKLVKYFRLAGYDIEVLTEKKIDYAIDDSLLADMEGIKVHYVQNSERFKKVYEKYKSFIKPYKEKRMSRLDNRERVNTRTGHVEFYPFETAYPIIGSIEYIIGQLRQNDLFWMAKKTFNCSQKYDLIITSYGDSFSYFFGKYYKKKVKTIKWVFDIRDAIYRYKFVPRYVAWIPKKYEKYIWKNSDAIVGVSKGICNRVPHRYKNKVHLITNGYDNLDAKNVEISKVTNKMSFTYTGSMYGGLQNLSKMFEAVRCLVDEHKIDESMIEFFYAGNKSAFDIFSSQAKKYGLNNSCVYKGKLSRAESIKLQMNSDILLMASYDYHYNNGGVITGKLFEYMASRRPVIAIVSGDIEQSEVSQIISKTNIGICYEQYNDQRDFIELKNYIFKQYSLFTSNKELDYLPNMEEICKYNYKYITKEYIDLMNDLLGR